jgi:hypothetical protein
MTENERIYAEREQRFSDIVALKKPDRLALMPQVVQGIPDQSKPENVLALRQAIDECGVF